MQKNKPIAVLILNLHSNIIYFPYFNKQNNGIESNTVTPIFITRTEN